MKVRLSLTGDVGFLCDECDALWLDRDSIGATGFIDFETYVRPKGGQGLWSEIDVLERDVT